MSDYQQFVDEIRFALQSEDCELTEDLRAAALGYAQACHEVNQRLRKIGSYLDGGLRSEAIQLAAASPSIEEVIGTLTFPELEAWKDVVAIYDLPRSEPLNHEVISQLQEAQVIELPLQNLLSQHRLLALHRAPLKMRLAVLRELRIADPETASWEEDVRTFEKARHQQLAEEIRIAQRQGNFSQLKELQEEITSDAWLEAPPKKLHQATRAALSELSRLGAQRQLDELTIKLESAFAELDFPRARELRFQWKEALRKSGPNANASLIDRIEPVLGWIQDEEKQEAAQKQYQQLTAQLEQKLDQSSSVEELDRLVHEIQGLDRDLPELLAIRYANRRESIQIGQARTHRLQVGSAVAVVLAMAVGVGFLVRHRLSASEADRVASQVQTLLDAQEFEQAEAILATRSDITQWDRLAELQVRLNTERTQEQERKARFAEFLSAAKNAETYPDAMQVIETARSHAVTPEEKLALGEVQQLRQRQHDEIMMAQETAIAASVLELSEELNQLENSMGNTAGDDTLAQSLVQMAKTIGELQRDAIGHREEFTGQIQLLARRRKELEDRRNERLTYQQRMADLTRHSRVSAEEINPDNAIDDFRNALLAFAEVIPQEQAAAMYRERANEAPHWKSAINWARQKRRWKQIWPKDLTENSTRVAACRTFLSDHPGSPDAAVIQKYIDQLTAISSITGHIDGSGTGLQTRLERVFSSPLVEKSWCLKTRDGRIFYLPENTPFTADGFHNFKYFIGYEIDDLDIQKGIQGTDLLDRTPSPSPSQLIAQSVKTRLQTLKSEEWNDFCLELCTRIRDDNDLNEFLKLDLLRRCLEMSANGDVFLRSQLQPHLKLLQEAALNPLARWMNPADIDGKRATEAARGYLTTLQRLKDLKSAWDDANQEREEFTKSMSGNPTMIGWLQAGDEWTCHLEGATQLPKCDLFVVFPPRDAKTSEWRKVGQLIDGQTELRPGTQEFLAAGRPLFAVPVIENASSKMQAARSGLTQSTNDPGN